MMNRSIYIFIFNIIFLVSCSNRSNLPKQEKENFKDFFIKFSNSQSFQKERILFPLTKVEFDEYGNDFSITQIPEEKWDYIDFSLDSLAQYKKVDRYETSQAIFNDSAKYIRKGIDNGINMEFVFKCSNISSKSQWYLVKINDNSW